MTRTWLHYARCRDGAVDPELFFPTARPGTDPYARQVAAAKAVCAGCPVRAECLEFALTGAIVEGVAGGLDEPERRRRGGRVGEPVPARPPSTVEVEFAARPGATRAKRVATAVALMSAGATTRAVADQFKVSERTVLRWRSAKPSAAA